MRANLHFYCQKFLHYFICKICLCFKAIITLYFFAFVAGFNRNSRLARKSKQTVYFKIHKLFTQLKR